MVLILAVLLAAACKKSSTSQITVGQTLTLGTGSMRSWVRTDNNGNPTSVGFTINSAALSALPSTHDTMLMLMLPSMVGGVMNMMAKPFDHVELDWSAMGDSNTNVFNHPHLDCHFFLTTMSAQLNIMMGLDTGMMNRNNIPQNCTSDGMAEAGMGVHWHDSTLAIYHGTMFDQTYMYGFYHGDMTFIEVMCAKSYLATKPNYSGVISQPAAFRSSGYYPLKYSITYDATADEYSYSIDNLMMH